MDNVMIVTESKQKEILYDDIFVPILIALREGPMTVKELDKKYENLLKTTIRKEGFKDPKKIKEEIDKRKRSGKSLYRYLKILEENKLVVQAGKRVDMTKSKTETLFSRTAKLFYIPSSNACVSDESLMKKVFEFVALTEKIPNNKYEEFSKLLSKIMNFKRKRFTEVFKQKPEEIAKIFTDINFDEMDQILSATELAYIILNSDIYEKELKSIR